MSIYVKRGSVKSQVFIGLYIVFPNSMNAEKLQCVLEFNVILILLILEIIEEVHQKRNKAIMSPIIKHNQSKIELYTVSTYR